MSINAAKRWILAGEINPEADLELGKFPPILRQILYNRGLKTFEDARRYLQASPPEGNQPANMLGIPAAVDLIWDAKQRGEPIAIYGDYDADGVTATALLTDVLRRLNAQVRGYIPNRFEEGYGLNKEALRNPGFRRHTGRCHCRLRRAFTRGGSLHSPAWHGLDNHGPSQAWRRASCGCSHC